MWKSPAAILTLLILLVIAMILAIIYAPKPANRTGVAATASTDTCFGENTIVSSFEKKKISEIEAGDVLEGGIQVIATMKLIPLGKYYNYSGVVVSGSHVVLHQEKWQTVAETGCPESAENPQFVYCLITNSHTIPICDQNGDIVLFSDYCGLDIDLTQNIIENLSHKK